MSAINIPFSTESFGPKFGGYNAFPGNFNGYESAFPGHFGSYESAFPGNHFGGAFNAYPGNFENSWANNWASSPSTGPWSNNWSSWAHPEACNTVGHGFAGCPWFPTSAAPSFFNGPSDFAGTHSYPWAPRGSFYPGFDASTSWAAEKASRHVLPREIRDVAFRPLNMVEYKTLSNPIKVHPVDGSRHLHVCFDVRGFKAEEVTVAVNNKERSITIDAKHESKDLKEHFISRVYHRKFVIPEHYGSVDLSKVELKSYLSFDGLLVVDGVLPRLTVEEFNKVKSCPTKTGVECFGGNVVSIPIKTVA